MLPIRLNKDFFTNDSIYVAKNLIGAVIETNIDGVKTSGIITETESYPSWDGASHAFMGKVTPRTKIQYEEGGRLYLYLIMGLHVMTSIVVNKIGVADVVFIRSIEPLEGVETMRVRRKYLGSDIRNLASGPGRLTQALGIVMSHNAFEINSSTSNICIYQAKTPTIEICADMRINLGTNKLSDADAKAAIDRKWRFYIKGSRFLS